ncbi:hypothetical protein B0H16DRAFT_1499513 [Mycena metata]|uniref:Uncharacterized protein n=1 Tax=Mycena metata TaxID=1033252 RepID=A0AAD7K6X9_9AGAR|nr:hypothetical protein B0H16DRAFT_1499513 [Mycena metata]
MGRWVLIVCRSRGIPTRSAIPRVPAFLLSSALSVHAIFIHPPIAPVHQLSRFPYLPLPSPRAIPHKIFLAPRRSTTLLSSAVYAPVLFPLLCASCASPITSPHPRSYHARESRASVHLLHVLRHSTRSVSASPPASRVQPSAVYCAHPSTRTRVRLERAPQDSDSDPGFSRRAQPLRVRVFPHLHIHSDSVPASSFPCSRLMYRNASSPCIRYLYFPASFLLFLLPSVTPSSIIHNPEPLLPSFLSAYTT